MPVKLLVFDSHPVQYRVPIWQSIQQMEPGSIHVVYASDCIIRGYSDSDFGRTLTWDEPMLAGYDYTILNCEKGIPLSSWGSLTGKGISKIIKQIKPSAILLTGLNYRYDFVAYANALMNNIPVWLRCETQDFAYDRSTLKAFIRSIIYKLAYTRINTAFYIGELNKVHYLKHKMPAIKLKPALYGTVNRFENNSNSEKNLLRASFRMNAGIDTDKLVIGFSGKFISKKNPCIIYSMLSHLPEMLRKKIQLYFMGSGPLKDELISLSERAFKVYNIKTYFSGFINQSELAGHYLAMDILVLPSRKEGETWGLVVNEAMQSGCSVVTSTAVGCSANFCNWERFKTFTEGNECELAAKIIELSDFKRNFDWANQRLVPYSIQSTAEAIIKNFREQSKCVNQHFITG